MMRSNPKPLKLLLVDDQEIDLRALETAFREVATDLDVTSLNNGQGAIERILHDRIDLVLLDINMPRVNGFDVITAVRAKMPGKRPAFIMLSSSKDASDMTRAYDAGVLSYLVKPDNQEGYRHLARNTLAFWDGLRPGQL